MLELVRAILCLGSASLATEEASCDAIVALRFPSGVACPCGASCVRELALVTCARNHRFTILVDTPFATKRRPRVRALLLAIRAFATSTNGVPTRQLARDVDMPHVTLWRHMHTLRALLPSPAARPSDAAAVVQVCGRRSPSTKRAFIRVGARVALTRELSKGPVSGNAGRLVAESVRAWLNGTLRGVSCQWLRAYLLEASTRWRVRNLTCDVLVERLLGAGESLTFARVQSSFS